MLSPDGRRFQDASFDIPQAILEDLYSPLLIKQGVNIMRVVCLTPCKSGTDP